MKRILLACLWTTGESFRSPLPPPLRVRPEEADEPSAAAIEALLARRHALVIAGSQPSAAVEIARALTDVGASVTLATAAPERCRRALRAQPGGRCELRRLELSDASAVWAFAEEFLRDECPLHLLVNCADDLHWRNECNSEGGWGRCHGTNHLGPFLLQQLLVDKMLLTMRKDAAALANASLPDTTDATQLASRMLRPHPFPHGRILTLGVQVRSTLRKVPSHRAGWRGRAAAMQANTLASLQLAERLRLAPVHAGEKAQPPPHIEVSIVHPGRLRWLPPPARILLGGLRAPTLACLYAASCPHQSVVVGAYLDGFSLAPPVRRSIDAGAESVAAAARAAYERALRLSSAPPRMLWEVVLETRRCSSRVTGTPRRPAQIRGAAAGPRTVECR